MRGRRKWFDFVAVFALAVLAASVMPLAASPGEDWRVEYFANTTLSGTPVCVGVYDYPNIDLNWGTSPPPDCAAVGAANYSVRFSGWFSFDEGRYSFWLSSDDGARLLIDGDPIIDEWGPRQAGFTTQERDVSADTWHLMTVEYVNLGGNAAITVFWQFEGGSRAPGPERRGEPKPGAGAVAPVGRWRAQFFNNTQLAGAPALERYDAEINFNWGYGSPGPGVRADFFSARWEQTVYFDAGEWEFTVRTDDGARLYINDQRVLDRWYPQWVHTYRVRQQLPAGYHTIRLEYFERDEIALIQLTWRQVGVPPTPTPPPAPPDYITFTANPPQIAAGQCTTISWNVQGVREVYFENTAAEGVESRIECPPVTRTYTLRVVRLDGGQDIRALTVTVGGAVQPPVGTGDVQITLTWNNTANLDLRVVDPTGFEIAPGSPVAPSGGRLERDANNPCTLAIATPVENVYWPTGTAPAGQYRVRVHYLNPCFGEGATSYTLTVRSGGQVLTTLTGVISLGQFLEVYQFQR